MTRIPAHSAPDTLSGQARAIAPFAPAPFAQAWGAAERLCDGDRFGVRRVVIDPGQRLALRSHVHRAAHWVIVSGTARVCVNASARLVSEGQSIHIPVGAVHSLENPGLLAVTLIEVLTGCYLGEDDIELHEDP